MCIFLAVALLVDSVKVLQFSLQKTERKQKWKGPEKVILLPKGTVSCADTIWTDALLLNQAFHTFISTEMTLNL